jgi:hypothetical protein
MVPVIRLHPLPIWNTNPNVRDSEDIYNGGVSFNSPRIKYSLLPTPDRSFVFPVKMNLPTTRQSVLPLMAPGFYNGNISS